MGVFGFLWISKLIKKLNNNGNFVNNSKHKDNIENSLMNSNEKKEVGFGFDLKRWVGFEKLPVIICVQKKYFQFFP